MSIERIRGKQIMITEADHKTAKMYAAEHSITIPQTIHLALSVLRSHEAQTVQEAQAVAEAREALFPGDIGRTVEMASGSNTVDAVLGFVNELG